MKRFLSSLFIMLLAAATVFSQTKPQGLSAQQAAGLEEAKQLSATTVELYREGKYQKALEPARRALEIRERILGPENEAVTNALGSLAAVYLALNNLKEAGPLYQRLLKLYEKQYGPESLKVAKLLEVLGQVSFAQNENSRTEDYYARSLAIREKLYGTESDELAPMLYTLAEFYQATEHYDKAEPLYQRAVAIREKVFGHAHEKTAEALDRYTCLKWKMNKEEKEAWVVGQREYGDSPTQEKKAKRVHAGVVNGKAITLAVPPYPPEAHKHHLAGDVTVRVVVNESGNVIRACAVEGPALFHHVSEAAALHSRFAPFRLEGQPVRVAGLITYKFKPF